MYRALSIPFPWWRDLKWPGPSRKGPLMRESPPKHLYFVKMNEEDRKIKKPLTRPFSMNPPAAMTRAFSSGFVPLWSKDNRIARPLRLRNTINSSSKLLRRGTNKQYHMTALASPTLAVYRMRYSWSIHIENLTWGIQTWRWSPFSIMRSKATTAVLPE